MLNQARLLYTLLDAAAAEGRLAEPELGLRWRVIHERFDENRGEIEISALSGLLDELDRRGALTGTWIQTRWRAVRLKCAAQIHRPFEPWSNIRSQAVDP